MARSPDAASGPLPTFLIVGAPRTGTTALATHLAEHPDVFVAVRKEVRFFDLNYERGVDWYRSHFGDAAGERAVGEASPQYLSAAAAVERIAGLLPDAKLVAILRNPIERAWSHHLFLEGLGFDRIPFEKRVRDERAGVAGEPLLAMGDYMPQLRRLCEHFPRESLLVLIHEDDLVASPDETFAKVCRFIGVDDGFRPRGLNERINAPHRIRSTWLLKHQLGLHLYRRMPRVARAVDRINRVPVPKAEMDPCVRAELVDYYAPGVGALADWLGRDLGGWKDWSVRSS